MYHALHGLALKVHSFQLAHCDNKQSDNYACNYADIFVTYITNEHLLTITSWPITNEFCNQS